MAKHGTLTPAPSAPEMKPEAHVTWDAGSKIKLSGEVEAIGLGKRVRLILEGPVTGFSMREYGCSLDLRLKTIRVDSVGSAEADEDAEPMTAMVESLKKKPPKKAGKE